MKKQRNLISAFLLIQLFCPQAFSRAASRVLGVAESYQAIPHQQTTFDSSHSTLPAADKVNYQNLFAIVDQAVVARVHYLRSFQAGEKVDDALALYLPVLNSLEQLKGKVNTQVFEAVLVAIQGQKKYFTEWNKLAAGSKFAAGDINVTNSSQKLHEAYSLLMSTFPKENLHNQKAFFDHLCALDFL